MLYRGFVRLILLSLVCFTFYFLNGGHLHIFWQPFELFMVVGIYAVMLYGMRVKMAPLDKSPENLIKLNSVGIAGLAASLIIPTLLGIVQTASYLTSGIEKIGEMVAASLVGIFYAISIYVCFFSGIEYLSNNEVVETSRSKKIKALAVPILAGVGAISAIVIFCVMLSVIFEGNPSYSAAEKNAIEIARSEIDKQVLKIECEKGERMPWEEQSKMEYDAVRRALASVKGVDQK